MLRIFRMFRSWIGQRQDTPSEDLGQYYELVTGTEDDWKLLCLKVDVLEKQLQAMTLYAKQRLKADSLSDEFLRSILEQVGQQEPRMQEARRKADRERAPTSDQDDGLDTPSDPSTTNAPLNPQ